MALSDVVAPSQRRKTGRKVWMFGSVTMMLKGAARALMAAGAAKDGALARLVGWFVFDYDMRCYKGGGSSKMAHIKPRSTAPTEEAFIFLAGWGSRCLLFEKMERLVKQPAFTVNYTVLYTFPQILHDHLILVFVPAPSDISPWYCRSHHFNFIYPSNVALCILEARTNYSLRPHSARLPFPSFSPLCHNPARTAPNNLIQNSSSPELHS
jgi:hypothetical protein